MKTCFKCNSTLPYSCFYKHPQMRDGYLNKCKDCQKRDMAKARENNIEYYREYDRRRGSRTTKSKQKYYRLKYPKVRLAQGRVSGALRAGTMRKPDACEECKENSWIVAHHDDYDRALDVRWLCQKCHLAWHKTNGPGLNKT